MAKDAPIVSLSDAYDGGNIEHVATKDGVDGVTIVSLRIKPDPHTELEGKRHFQYFSFRSTLSGISTPATFRYVIENAGQASYAAAWDGFTTFASKTLSDPHSWERILDTAYDKESGQLTWTYSLPANSGGVYFAYFPPYSYDRHLDLIARCASSSSATVSSLGQTLDGREMDCITVGSGPRICWIIHRQHPGESMAEYYAEGLLTRLLGLDSRGSVDGMAARALTLYTFHIVPNMNPDGSVRGHLRTNAIGSNLNREWAPSSYDDGKDYDAPTLERSPEVYHVLNAMDETGVDAFLDVHGDEELPYNFLSGSEGCPNFTDRLKNLHGAFLSSYGRANSDMQSKYGYDPDPPKEGKTNICSNQIAIRFDCFSGTLEMPFKDCMSNPDPVRGWSPGRAMKLGESVLDALVYVHPYLREEGEFWTTPGWKKEDDRYVRPTHNYKNVDG